MPLISDINKNKIKKVFKGQPYRPWDEEVKFNSPLLKKESILENDEPAADISNKCKLESSFLEDVKNDKDLIDIKKKERSLYGAQRNILFYLLSQIEEGYGEYVVTKNLSIHILSEQLNIIPNTVIASLQRLKAKKLIKTHEKKTGRGGFARYMISNEIYTFFTKYIKESDDSPL